MAYTLYAPERGDYFGSYQFLTESGINYFADKLYNNSISVIKSAFEQGGIDLITLDDMTDQQKAILSDTQGETWLTNLGKENNKLINAYQKVEEKGVKVGTSVEGYKNWTINRGLPVYWDVNMIAKIVDALEVDAVLLINNNVSPEKKSLVFHNTMLTLIGNNPIQKVEGKKYPGLSYSTGLCYSQIVFIVEKGLDLAGMKKGEIESENFQDYDKLMGLTVDRMLQSIEQNTTKSKERNLKQKK